MRINTNMAALNAWRSMTANGGNMQKSLEKLSSGYRINRAADDAAGLAVSEKMRAQIRGTNQAIRNAQDGISLVQTAEGALTETHSILQRMRELSVQASTETLSTEDRDAISAEMNNLVNEIDRISSTTKFNGTALLDGTMAVTKTGAVATEQITVAATGVSTDLYGSLTLNGTADGTYTISAAADVTNGGVDFTITNGTDTVVMQDVDISAGAVRIDQFGIAFNVAAGVTTGEFATAANGDALTVSNQGKVDIHIGANGASAADEKLEISIDDMSSDGLNVDSLSVSTATNAKSATDSIDAALTLVSTQRASLGAIQNRLEHTVANLGVTSENLSAAESRIRDVDMASEMATFTKNQILQQASTAMLAQANQATQGILSLLR